MRTAVSEAKGVVYKLNTEIPYHAVKC